jgi:hypothetical protein
MVLEISLVAEKFKVLFSDDWWEISQ